MSKNKQLLTIARKYYQRLERYRKAICSEVDINGTPKPNKTEKSRIKYNNKFELEWSVLLGSFEGIPPKDIRRAVKEYRRRLYQH